MRNATSQSKRKEPVRFDSIRFRTFRKSIGSVRFGHLNFPVRRGSACVFQTPSWLGLVRFGSVPHPVPVGSEIKRVGSVRFGRFGLVSDSFLTHLYHFLTHFVLTILSYHFGAREIPEPNRISVRKRIEPNQLLPAFKPTPLL